MVPFPEKRGEISNFLSQCISAPIIFAGALHCHRIRVSLGYELISAAERKEEREREKQANRTWEKHTV
jgi:hypothetical protein